MFALTQRLTLRPGWAEDAPALARAIGHETVVRNLARAPWPYALGDAEAFLSLPRAADEPRFQIVRRGDGQLIGGIALVREEHGHELGYWLAPDHWHRGYATEAGRAVVEMARHALGLNRIHARHHVDNPASGRVLRKLGFVETGRGESASLARGGTVASVEMLLDLAEADVPAEPAMAA